MESRCVFFSGILAIILIQLSCSRVIGRYEPIDAAHYAIVINKETKIIEDEELRERGPVFVWPSQCLMQFDRVGDTIKISGHAFTQDSILVIYNYQIRFTYQKMYIIEMYKRHGFDYKEFYYLPEMIFLTRKVISGIRKNSSEDFFKSELTSELKKFTSSNYLHFQSVMNVELVERYSGKYFFP